MPTTTTTSTPAGLTSSDARRRLDADGPNALPAPKPPAPLLLVLLRQLTHFFALMLWVAAALAVVGGMPALGVAIAVVIVVNGVFAFVQEYRAGQRLQELLPLRATVLRDGHRVELPAAELVRDDVVLLAAGDRICADLVLRHVDGLGGHMHLFDPDRHCGSRPDRGDLGSPAGVRAGHADPVRARWRNAVLPTPERIRRAVREVVGE